MTTQELVERLRSIRTPGNEFLVLQAASRLSEMEGENKRLREALTFIVETRDCLHDPGTVAGFEYYRQSCAVCKARAALEHQQKGEKL